MPGEPKRPPFAQVPEWVLDAEVSDRAVRLYGCLNRYSRDGRRDAFPGKDTLADRMHCSTRALERAADELVAIGAIAIVTPRGAANRYRVFHVPTFVERPAARMAEPATPLSEVAPETCDTTVGGLTLVSAEPATPVVGTCDTTVGGFAKTCDTGVAQKERTTEGETSKETEATASSTAVDIDEAAQQFELFWQQYPRRNGKREGKADALKVWRRMTLDDRRAAWRGVQHYAAAVDDDLTIAADAVRFLRHRRFEDWQTAAVPDIRRNGNDRHASNLLAIGRGTGVLQ